MRPVLIPEGFGAERVMNPVQYCHQHAHSGMARPAEFEMEMTKHGSMNGVPRPADHYMAQVEHKIIESTKRTERHNEAAPAEKAFSTMAKSGYHGAPNNHGSSVIKGIYKQGAERHKMK